MDSSEYPLMYKVEDQLWWYAGLRDSLQNALRIYARRSALILDAGCGTGKNSEFLRSLGYRTAGIDFSEDAIRFCRLRGLDNIQFGSITDVPFPNETFDAVICMDVLGLLPDELIHRSISEFHRVLKPGGTLLVHCAALEWLRSQHDDVSHLRRRFSREDLVGFFGRGWQLRRASYRMMLLFGPLAALKLFKRLLSNVGQQPSGDLYLPPTALNRLLRAVQLVENQMLKRFDLPFGTSLFIVARRFA